MKIRDYSLPSHITSPLSFHLLLSS